METFKQFEQQGWARCAKGYQESFVRLTTQTIPALVESLRIVRGERVLDVATGLGNVAAACNEAGANVFGLDFSSEMLEAGQKLHPQIQFQQGDAENLPFIDSSFDVVAMNFGILHLSEPEQAIREANRVLKPGGRFAITAWARPFQIIHDAVETEGDPSVTLPPGPDFIKFGDPENAEHVFKNAGFRNIKFETLNLTWAFQSPEEVYDAFFEGAARVGGLLRRQPPDAQKRIRSAVIREAQRLRVGDRVLITTAVTLTVGVR